LKTYSHEDIGFQIKIYFILPEEIKAENVKMDRAPKRLARGPRRRPVILLEHHYERHYVRQTDR